MMASSWSGGCRGQALACQHALGFYPPTCPADHMDNLSNLQGAAAQMHWLATMHWATSSLPVSFARRCRSMMASSSFGFCSAQALASSAVANPSKLRSQMWRWQAGSAMQAGLGSHSALGFGALQTCSCYTVIKQRMVLRAHASASSAVAKPHSLRFQMCRWQAGSGLQAALGSHSALGSDALHIWCFQRAAEWLCYSCSCCGLAFCAWIWRPAHMVLPASC